MNSLARCLLPAVALLLVGLASAAIPGRAQPTTDVRFAFADTTLLRDTLDLRFDGLFELADSLDVLPDTLRALSIRHLLPLPRLLFLADSLGVPVDSVGPLLERERYNPLAFGRTASNDLTYGSAYTISRQNSSWANTADYNLVRGPLFVRNNTSVTVTRTRQVGGTAEYRVRNSSTETGWRFSRDFSLGARINLERTENSALSRVITNDEYQFSLRFKRQMWRDLITQFSAFGGPFNEPNSTPEKRGLGATFSGSILYRNHLFSHDLNLQATERRGDGRQPDRPWLQVHDLARSLNGTLSVLPSGAAALRVRYNLLDNHTERPSLSGSDNDYVSRSDSYGKGVEADLRLRGRSDRTIGVSGTLRESRSFLELARKDQLVYEPIIVKERGFQVDGRYTLSGWTLDASFSNSFPTNDGPSRGTVDRTGAADTTVDYRERDEVHNRAVTMTLGKALWRSLVVRATGTVSLNSYRYVISDSSYRAAVGDGRVTPTAPREDYRQSYRIEGSFSPPGAFSTAVELEVSRSLNMFLVGSRSAQNGEDRNYRAVWRWTYRLMRGLTATQRNQMSAVYSHPAFTPDQKRLSLSYLTTTTLNAVITPRLNMNLTYSRNLKPRGNYTPGPDGLALYLSDESRDYVVNANLSYQPRPSVSFRINPLYQAIHSDGTSLGQAVPKRRTRTFSLNASANLNLQVASRARLTGTFGRSLNASREVRYSSGTPDPGPRAEYDHWTGSLQLSWNP